MSRRGPVRAAGGVVLDDHGRVAVVHRPHRDDWSLPKGHLEAGESDEEAAVREVHEEAGIEARIVDDAGTTSYVDHHGRPKVVRYFVMTATGGRFSPNDEADELRWIGPEELDLLTYADDRAVVGAVLQRDE